MQYSALATLVLAAAPLAVSAHSSLSSPISRQKVCYPWSNSAYSKTNCGSIEEYNAEAYRSVYHEDRNNIETKLKRGAWDGWLCTGGLSNLTDPGNQGIPIFDYDHDYTPVDIPAANHYAPGQEIELKVNVTAAHKGFIKFFITKDNTFALYRQGSYKFADFEEIQNCMIQDVNTSGVYTVKCRLPERYTDKHTILYVYQCGAHPDGTPIVDGTGEVFSGCADIMIDGLSEGAQPPPEGETPGESESGSDDEEENEGDVETVTVTVTTTVSTEYVTSYTSTTTVTITDDNSPTSPPPGDDEGICASIECSNSCAMEFVSQGLITRLCLPGVPKSECPVSYSSNGYSYAWC